MQAMALCQPNGDITENSAWPKIVRGSLCRCSSCPVSSIRRVVAKIRDNLLPLSPFSLPAVGVETIGDAVLFALSRATHKEMD